MPFKKIINTKALDLLTKLDFFFFQYKNNTSNNRLIKKKIKMNTFNKKKTFTIINPLEFLKSLKQIIRVFQFLKNNNSIKYTFGVRNEYSFQLLKNLLEKNLPQLINIFEFQQYLRINALDTTSKAVFFFNSVLKETNLVTFIKTNKYLVSEFSQNDRVLKDLGNFRLFANFNDSKKIVFLILLLKHIYK